MTDGGGTDTPASTLQVTEQPVGDIQDDANREQTSRKRAGSPLLSSGHPLDSDARPVKRLLSTDQRKPASSVNEPIGSSVELDPTAPSLPPLHSSFRTSFSSPPASQHSVEAGKGKKARDDAAAPPSGQEEKPPVTLEQQASIYPTPQTGDFHDRETFELPPLQPRTPHTNGNGQATPVTLPHFNEIYGDLELNFQHPRTFSSHMHSAFTRPEYGLSTYTDPRDGQQPFSSPQYPYNSSSGPDTHQLPLPNQPFLPTPDRLVLAQARYQQGEDLPPLRTVPSQQAQQESPQFAKAFHSSHTSNLLSSNEEATAHEGLGQPLSASIEATFRKPTPAPARQAFPAPGSSAPNHGLGIIYMDRRQPSVQRYDYTYEPPRNCHLSAQTPNKPRFAPAPPDPATLYAMHQQGVLQGAQEQNVAEESKVFRYAHFPPETYNVTGRPSATNGFDSGAGATLARAPSFNSPHGRPIAGLPQSVTISQNQLPRYVFDDNPILTPDGPVYLPNAHRIIEQIDLPTLQNGLRHWESVLSNPSSSPQTKNEAAISCQILENRIRIVTSATQDRVSSEERRFIPPGTKSATQNAQRYERRASPQGQSRTPQPILPAARARTHSSENVISPSQALPTSVVKCSILSEELTSISPAQGKFIAVPSPPAHPMASSPVAEITSAGKNDSVPASSHATAQTAVPPIADQKKSSHPGKPAAKKARKSASAASKGKRSGGDSAKENAPQDASLLQPPLPADGPDSPAASPKTEEAGTANSAAVVSPGTTKKPASKALISTPILSEGGNEPRSGDLIWAADWNQQDHLALKLAVGPPSPEDVTYSWSDIECKQERRLMHITASISSNWVNVKIAPLQPRDYTSASDKSPDPQGSVVSCIFAEIVQKAHSQDKVPIYWISYWDVIKICEVCLDLTHRTFRLKRGHDPKPRIRSVLDKLEWIDIKKKETAAQTALVNRMLQYPRALDIAHVKL